MTASSSTAIISSLRRSISHPGLKRTRRSAADSPRMLQGLGTWHRRIAMSNTSGLRSHAVYTGEKSLDPSAIILDILDFRLRLRTVSEAEKLFITRLGNKMCSNQDIRSLRE